MTGDKQDIIEILLNNVKHW